MASAIDRFTLCAMVIIGNMLANTHTEWYWALIYWVIFWWWFDGSYIHKSKVTVKAKNDTAT